MTTLIGSVVIISVVAGGLYLYTNISRLDKEITKQTESSRQIDLDTNI